MFDGFRLDFVDVGEVRLRVRYGGNGPAVLLVHGHPRTHTTWCDVAPSLVVAGYSVVCPDLRGYGESSVPPDRPDHSQASKRAMAADLATLMEILGYGRFHAVGHDRGGYVVQRLALDHPARVGKIVILGDVPIGEALARCDARFAAAWWHWFFMGQPAPLAERLIAADADAWYKLDPSAMGEGTTPTRHEQLPARQSSTRCARTTAPVSASTAPPTTPTATPGARSPARSLSYGVTKTTLPDSTITMFSASGARGRRR
jgi:haloacetate dehalogenase